MENLLSKPDVPTETEIKEYMNQRDDLETPHQCTGEPVDPDVGVPLELIEEHTNILNQIVNQMMEDMTRETRILEGMEIPTYAVLLAQLDKENELSEEKKDKQ